MRQSDRVRYVHVVARWVTRLGVAVAVSVVGLAAQDGATRRALRAAVADLDVQPETGVAAVSAVEAYASFDTRRAADTLLDLASDLGKRIAPIVEDRRKALFGDGGSGRMKRSRYELQNLTDTLEAIARVLEGFDSTDALREMLERVTDRGHTLPLWLRLRLAAAVARLPEGELDWRPDPRKRRKDDTLIAVLTAVAALGPRVAEGGAAEWLVQQLTNDNPDVRSVAARALGGLAWPGAVEPLIARIDVEDPGVREAVLDALVVLTGEWPGDNGGSWRAWLAAEGEHVLSGRRELGQGDAQLRRQGEGQGGTSAGSYFGIAQTGASILYVIDNSLSMKAKVRQVGTGEAKTRWEVCKRELRGALKRLAPSTRFNIVSFANKARAFDQHMLTAEPDTVARAIEWVDALELEFQTNVFDALELAFAIAGRGIDDRYYQSEVDTIFFLSDGAPTIPNLDKRGIRRDDAERILLAVRRWNALRRVTIHAVGIGLRNRRQAYDDQGRMRPTAFLQRLAAQNGGRYRLHR